jgi:Ring finger domain
MGAVSNASRPALNTANDTFETKVEIQTAPDNLTLPTVPEQSGDVAEPPLSPVLADALQPVVRLRCGGHHVMHRECVYAWFGKSRQCPMCKDDLSVHLGA